MNSLLAAALPLAVEGPSEVSSVTRDANWFLENAWIIPLLPAISFVLILFFALLLAGGIVRLFWVFRIVLRSSAS